jgi:enamine deaminase RidA (YjgF/YER057c/UK114 family)
MFEVAETMLQQAGMNFSDVMRTWIYFPEMERDYAEFNRARRQFFESRGIDPVPASTGIGGRLASPDHKLCLGIYAVASTPPAERVVMTTPTLNEAPEYGSDFSRGMRVPETNKVSLLISGTASLDVTGATVCVGDFEGQARRMLLNVEALLKAQGASFDEVVSAITYVKHAEDAHRLQAIFQEVGYDRFPNVIVAAEVCRPELLCETELVAVKSRGNA